jgi:hypothetical protein
VLNKEPKGRDVDDTDVFHFNSKLDVKPLRIKINSIQLKETQEENDKTTEVILSLSLSLSLFYLRRTTTRPLRFNTTLHHLNPN